MKNDKPYSQIDYDDAKQKGFDLDNWDDYCNYFHISENFFGSSYILRETE